MALFGGGNHHSFGLFSAFILNVCLLALPFAAISTWQTLQNTTVYNYDSTPAAKADTRAAVERAAATLIPPNVDREARWSQLVQREMDEGDFAAARGFLLAAPAMLPADEGARLTAQVPANADAKARIAAALVFLDRAVRKQYEAGASPLNAASPAAGVIPSDFFKLPDASALAAQGSQWLSGDAIDAMAFTLDGVGLALADDAAGAGSLRIAVSTLEAAKRAGKLSAQFMSALDAALLKAAPPARLKPAIAAALAGAKPGEEGARVIAAFRQSLDPNALTALRAPLAEIQKMTAATSPVGAVLLTQHARTIEDLARLRLIAEAGGDRAIATAKRLDDQTLLRAAKGSLRVTQALVIDFALLGLALIGFGGSFLSTLGQALLREWRHGAPAPDQREAEAV